MPSFNLVHEPWIPCVSLGGEALEVGLQATLLRAHEVREISDPSPLVTVALHRLLLAVLHRVFGPGSVDEWATLWRGKRVPEDPIREYLRRWEARFDLFDEERPFYQTAGLEEATANPAAKLVHELASGHNATLFDHTRESSSGAGLSFLEAARVVVAHQAFAVCGLVSFRPNEDRKAFGSADNAPLVKGAVTLVRGQSLFHTLMLNLHQYSTDDEVPFALAGNDCPAWERVAPVEATDRRPAGYLDLLTWQSRRIRLFPAQGPNGEAVVSKAAIMKGEQFPDGFSLVRKETMLSFRRRADSSGEDPWQPMKFVQDRAIWRDSLALLQSADDSAQTMTLAWLRHLLSEGVVERSHAVLVDLLGLSTDRANLLFWRHERLALPSAYLEDEQLRRKLSEAVGLAEAVARVVSHATGDLARLVLSRGSDNPEGRQPRREDVTALRDHLGAERVYWSRLDRVFRRLLFDLAQDRVEDDQGVAYGLRALPGWAEDLRSAARDAFSAGTHGLEATAQGAKAVALSETRLNRDLWGTLKDYVADNEEVAR